MSSGTTVNSAGGLGNVPAAAENGHSGHANTADQGATPSFATSYALALNKPSLNPNVAATAGRAQQAPAAGGSYPSSLGNISKHIALAGQSHGTGDHAIHETALALRAYRLQLLASNISNADTPGYKAVDIDVEEALRNGWSTPAEVPLKYRVPTQPSIDGNTVELDAERAKFAQTAIRYQFSLERAIGHYTHMMELLRNLKD